MMTHSNQRFKLIVRQQPLKARLCSFKEKVDRRPIDPPAIVQLTTIRNNNDEEDDEYLQNPYFFLYTTLLDANSDTDLHFVNGTRTTAGTVVQSLHKLKDIDNTEGGFFIFSDVSVRLEGFFRLKFTLFEIIGASITRICHVNSDIFQVFLPKCFPGMSESTFLTRSFSDQGVRIRIRKEPRASNITNSTTTNTLKRRRSTTESDESNQTLSNCEGSSSFQNPALSRVILPSPRELLRSSAMSMQNLLSEHHDMYSKVPPFPTLPPPKTSPPSSLHWLHQDRSSPSS